MRITRTSPFTGKIKSRNIPVTPEQMEAWRNGTLIQVAMPNISPADREFIKTGITDEEWTDMFGKPEDFE